VKKVAKATVSAPLAHQVHQKVYSSPDCSGGSSDSDFSGDKVCFKTGDGKSEDIQCDPDNAAMHVTKYSDELCTTYLNAFSIPSGQCHQESSDQSFKWSCYENLKKVAKATVSAPLAHQVHQKVYSSPDCSGDSSDTDFSGDKVCFTTDDGKSEDILCDPDNAAMHVTKYSDAHCTTYLNAFSIPSGQCHQESSDRSFQWSCYEGVKKVAKATVPATSGHQVHQKVYSSPDCSGDSSDSDFSGDKVCFTTDDGKSEDILCDPDNAAMHVTKYSDAHCTTYLNAFSIPSGQCHQESSDRSFQWSCYEGAKKVAKATDTVREIVV